jgi:hypothetical protein
MRKAHRAAHRRVWPILALLVGAGLVLALALRPAPDQPVVAQEMPR